MKHLSRLLMLGLSMMTLASSAAPPTDEVPVNAKWMLYLDFDQFRSTKIGAFLVKTVMDQGLDKQLAELKAQIHFDLDPTKINAITIYGTDYEIKKSSGDRLSAVVLVKTSMDVQTGLDAALGAITLLGTNAPPLTSRKTQHEGVTDYTFNDTVFVSVQPSKLVVVAGSAEDLQKENDVLAGKASNVGSGKAFSGFPEVKKSFFFMAVAEAFNPSTPFPAQAKVLQMADGGRVVLGEDSGKLFLNLALRAKTEEIVTQMQQIIQGLVALASISQRDDKDLTQLAQSIKVTTESKLVNVSVEFPVDKAIEKIGEHHTHHDHESHAKEHHEDSDAPKPEPKN